MKLLNIGAGAACVTVDALASLAGGGLITLYMPTVSASNYQTLFRDLTAAAYAAGTFNTGKNLLIMAAQIEGGGALNNFADFGYGDTAVSNSASAPTNNKGFSGVLSPRTLAVPDVQPVWISVPNGKYPYVKLPASGGPQGAIFWCIEE